MSKGMLFKRNIVSKALQIRQSQGFDLKQAICVFDLAEAAGVKVYFDSIGSMEGTYLSDPLPRILLSSLRPAGRMAYNCAHEFGHHIFGHSFHVDELIENSKSGKKNIEEFIADCFAGFLLMPKLAVSYGFAKRGWETFKCTPEQVYTVAGWLGVGYTALINHMCSSLKLLPKSYAEEVRKVPPKKIRASILDREVEENLVVVDQEWIGRPIDIQVGDFILFESNIRFEGKCIECVPSRKEKQVFRGECPGIGQVYSTGASWNAFVRVSRKEYTGHCMYRHLEEPKDE